MSKTDNRFFTLDALKDVEHERDRQEQIGRDKAAQGIEWTSCADPNMVGGDGTRLAVLGEEFGEVARALLEGQGLRDELIQVAAVAVAWVESIDEAESYDPAAPSLGEHNNER